MRVLSWNLFHGRAVPGAGHDLRGEFARALAGWDWDVALLQEVPPWWPSELARACDADARSALTSRNALLVARRFAAERRPDVIKSSGGGANAILVRGGAIAGHRHLLLRRWPERRVCHAVALHDGLWCANLHAQVRPPERAHADIVRAAAAALSWSRGGPTVLGGDFNVRRPSVPGFEWLGGNGVDHVFGHDVAAGAPVELSEHGRLSDHAPVIVTALPREHAGAR